jgi:hypothetical protein
MRHYMQTLRERGEILDVHREVDPKHELAAVTTGAASVPTQRRHTNVATISPASAYQAPTPSTSLPISTAGPDKQTRRPGGGELVTQSVMGNRPAIG